MKYSFRIKLSKNNLPYLQVKYHALSLSPACEFEGILKINVRFGTAFILFDVPSGVVWRQFPISVEILKITHIRHGPLIQQSKVKLQAIIGPGAELESALNRVVGRYGSGCCAVRLELNWLNVNDCAVVRQYWHYFDSVAIRLPGAEMYQ